LHCPGFSVQNTRRLPTDEKHHTERKEEHAKKPNDKNDHLLATASFHPMNSETPAKSAGQDADPNPRRQEQCYAGYVFHPTRSHDEPVAISDKYPPSADTLSLH
jgi:hypothetical protein